MEDEESELFIEVDCFNVEPILGPAPEGLSQQQVSEMRFSSHFRKPTNLKTIIKNCPLQLVRRCILGSILESEKNYLDALKRILEVYQDRSSNLPVLCDAFDYIYM